VPTDDHRTIPLSGEVSAIDKDSQFLIHNSPLGYLFLSGVYLLTTHKNDCMICSEMMMTKKKSRK